MSTFAQIVIFNLFIWLAIVLYIYWLSKTPVQPTKGLKAATPDAFLAYLQGEYPKQGVVSKGILEYTEILEYKKILDRACSLNLATDDRFIDPLLLHYQSAVRICFNSVGQHDSKGRSKVTIYEQIRDRIGHLIERLAKEPASRTKIVAWRQKVNGERIRTELSPYEDDWGKCNENMMHTRMLSFLDKVLDAK